MTRLELQSFWLWWTPLKIVSEYSNLGSWIDIPNFEPFLPFTDVEDSWSFQHEDFQVMRLDTAGGDLLKGPVPVVVVVGAECPGAVLDLVPDLSGEGHPHVVLWRDPVSELCLIRFYFKSSSWVEDSLPLISFSSLIFQISLRKLKGFGLNEVVRLRCKTDLQLFSLFPVFGLVIINIFKTINLP